MNRLVTITSDFGHTDHFVGTMKGVILSINPQAQIYDICNSVNSFDVLDGALTVAQAYSYFPSNTVHMVIVDPGVGTNRRPLLVVTERHMFLAPDNGVLSFVFEKETERLSVRHITSTHYFLQPVSQTFHGRDIFAACAGWLSKGVEVSKFGEEITDYIRFNVPKPKPTAPNQIKGAVLKVDKFGNLITNITPHDAPALFSGQVQFHIAVGKGQTGKLAQAYAQGQPGELFGILGSMGYLEISANKTAAAQVAQAARGMEVVVTFAQPVFAPPQAAPAG